MDAVHQKISMFIFFVFLFVSFLEYIWMQYTQKFNLYIYFFSVNTERLNSESNGPKSDSDQD